MTTEKYIERTITSGGGGGGPDNAKTLSAQEYLHKASVSAGTPLLQSFITGFVVAVPFTVGFLKFRVEDAWFWGFGIWGVVQAVVWILIQLHWFNLTTLENVTGLDLNKDGVIGDGKNESVRKVRIDMEAYDKAGVHRSTTRAHFDNESLIYKIAEAVMLQEKPISVKQIVEVDKLMSRDDFDDVREEMEKRGIVVMKNPMYPKLGYKPTYAGKAVFRDMLGIPHSPTE